MNKFNKLFWDCFTASCLMGISSIPTRAQSSRSEGGGVPMWRQSMIYVVPYGSLWYGKEVGGSYL
eukprot:scaffold5822_cov46-Cyclotella_meneghiniana.AAC.3